MALINVLSATASSGLTENSAESVFGGLLIEISIACILYGITTLQSFIYFNRYQEDQKFLKLLVAVVWILETAHTAFCIQCIYAYTIQGFGNYQTLFEIDWSVGVTVVLEVLLSTLVQAFYVRRVWIVSEHSKILTVTIASFATCRIGFGVGSTILSYKYPGWLEFRGHASSLITVSGGLGAAALVDVMVALTLSFYLTRGRNKWPKESKSRIDLVMLYAVNTGAITCTASVLSVILYATQKESLVFLGLVEIQGKLYANSLLGSLNARSHIRNKGLASPQQPSFESFGTVGFRSTVSIPSRTQVPEPKAEAYRLTIITRDAGVRSNYSMQTMKGCDLA